MKMEQYASDGESQSTENKDKRGFMRFLYVPKQGPTHPQKSRAVEGLNEQKMVRLQEG